MHGVNQPAGGGGAPADGADGGAGCRTLPRPEGRPPAAPRGPRAMSFTPFHLYFDDLRRVRACVQADGEQWPARWLRERGCEAEARWWEQEHTRVHRVQTEDVYGSVFLDHGAGGDGAAPTR